MVRGLLLLAILPGLLVAQFQNLVTADEGSLLLFSSRLQLQGTAEYSWDKLFSNDSSALDLYHQRQEQPEPPPSQQVSRSTGVGGYAVNKVTSKS